MAFWAFWAAAGAGELRFGGFETPEPKPAKTFFMAVACFGWGAVTLVLGEEGNASAGLSGKRRDWVRFTIALARFRQHQRES